MHKAYKDVRDFMIMAGQETPNELQDPYPGTRAFGALSDWVTASAHAVEQLKLIDNIAALRARLMIEELEETVSAMSEQDMAAVADGLADLCYVTIGTAVAFGIPMPPVWDAVQAANMAKGVPCPEPTLAEPGLTYAMGLLDHTRGHANCERCRGTGMTVLKDRGGKGLKPEGWMPPDVAAVLRNPPPDLGPQMWAVVTAHELSAAEERLGLPARDSAPIGYTLMPLRAGTMFDRDDGPVVVRSLHYSLTDAQAASEIMIRADWPTWNAEWKRRHGIG